MSKHQRLSVFPAGMVIYQIYPRSFRDTNGDGIGDLTGVCEKLDYLKDLGVTTIWLSPIYKSPMLDGGYDVADYYQIDPIFGTLKDLDRLVDEVHKRDLKLILDLVVNHTSDQHAWFQESRSSLHNPKRDWYVWRAPAPDGSEPNNWLSTFSGSAWQLDSQTNQYYLHSFGTQQPDLNWRNPAVRNAIKEVMRFWFERGVDGFRVDAVFWLSKDDGFRDDLKNPAYDPATQAIYNSLLHAHSKRGPRLYTYLKELSKVAKSYNNRLLITEAYPHRRFGYQGYLNFYQKIDPSVLAPFNFEGIYLPWKADAFKRYIDGFQSRLLPQYVPVYALSNHDKPRIATRFGQAAARTTAFLLLTLPGVPTIYYGDEIGMENVSIPKKYWQDAFSAGIDGNRDRARTPMQWSAQKNAGFSTVTPWLPVATDYQVRNVERQAEHPASLLSLYKKLLGLRSQSEALSRGAYYPLHLDHPDLFGFRRETKHERLTIVINFSRTDTIPLNLPGEVLAATTTNPHQTSLRPLEGRILSV